MAKPHKVHALIYSAFNSNDIKYVYFTHK